MADQRRNLCRPGFGPEGAMGWSHGWSDAARRVAQPVGSLTYSWAAPAGAAEFRGVPFGRPLLADAWPGFTESNDGVS